METNGLSYFNLTKFCIIMFGFFNRKNKSSDIDSHSADSSLSSKEIEKIDMNNIILSIFHAESLYNKLKIKCHPDRFIDNELLRIKAEDIFKEVTENKRNFNRLQELQLIAEGELNIKF